jgi:integrase
MPRDVTDRVRLPRARKAAAATTIPTAEQVGAVLAADAEFAAFIAVSAFAGLRRGESSALKVSDINFLREEVHVRRQVQWTDDGQMEIRGPKYGAERTVYVPDGLVTLLAQHVQHWTHGEDPDRWPFPGRRDHDSPPTPPPSRGPGGPPAAPPASGTDCTTCDTSTPPGSSERAAISSRSSGRRGIPPRPSP